MGLINLRNALMAGKRLPYDAEIEFLQSTGTQWIDTGVVATQVFGCEIAIEDVATNVYNCFIQNQTSDDFCIGSKNSSIQSSYIRIRSSLTWADNIGASKTFSISGGVINANGVKLGTYDATKSLGTNANNIGLFGGPTGARLSQCKIFSCKLYDSNGVLVRDFIPVRKGTVGYLYDRVSGKLFGNAGTGDFVLGPDVVPVEYLQGCLGGYVDTGIKSLNTISTDISFSVVNPTHDSAAGLGILLYGNGTTWAFYSYAIFFQNTLNQPDYKSLSSHGRNNILVQTPQNSFDCNVGVACDGTSTATVTTTYNGTTTSRSISISAIDGTKNFILLWNRLLDDNTVITRLKSAEFISGGATIAKFVSVRVGTDATSWEGAMMDVLTRRIYRNAGTGAFTYGNDLKYPIPA